jgi:hypothetical protein
VRITGVEAEDEDGPRLAGQSRKGSIFPPAMKVKDLDEDGVYAIDELERRTCFVQW